MYSPRHAARPATATRAAAVVGSAAAGLCIAAPASASIIPATPLVVPVVGSTGVVIPEVVLPDELQPILDALKPVEAAVPVPVPVPVPPAVVPVEEPPTTVPVDAPAAPPASPPSTPRPSAPPLTVEGSAPIKRLVQRAETAAPTEPVRVVSAPARPALAFSAPSETYAGAAPEERVVAQSIAESVASAAEDVLPKPAVVGGIGALTLAVAGHLGLLGRRIDRRVRVRA